MSEIVLKRLGEEADLIEQFTSTYGRKFAALIDQMNHAPSPTDVQCIRLCVEAVNMMLVSQQQVARSIRELARPPLRTARAA